MSQLRTARAVGGVLAVGTLLALFLLNFLKPELQLQRTTIWILLGLISALLGVDTMIEKLPVNVEISDQEGAQE